MSELPRGPRPETPRPLTAVLRDLHSRGFTGSAEIHFHRGVPRAIEVGRPERIELLPTREGLDLSARDLARTPGRDPGRDLTPPESPVR